MAKKKETQEPDGVLVAAARTVGAAAGTIAAVVGITAPRQLKVPKLVSKNNSRLPRRQKKAAKKVAKGSKQVSRIKATR